MKEQHETFNILIGVLVSICGNALISVALNLQKRAHNKIQERQMNARLSNIEDSQHWAPHYHGFLPDDEYSSLRPSLEEQNIADELIKQQKSVAVQEKVVDTGYLKSRLWWLGISLMILGEVGNFVAYGFAPASTIAPLGTTTLVANVIVAPLMLKEKYRKRDFIGVFLAVVGAATVVFSSNSEGILLSPKLIAESITQPRAIIYYILTCLIIVILTVLSPIYGPSNIAIDLGLVAIYGGYTVLCTKSVASLLSLTFLKMFSYPVSYVLIIVLVVTAVLQIKYLNKALQRFESTAVIPTQFVLFTVSAIVGSAVLYHDFDNATANQLLTFVLGCAVEFLGVYLITSNRLKTHNRDLFMDEDKDVETLYYVDSIPSEHPTSKIISKINPTISSRLLSDSRQESYLALVNNSKELQASSYQGHQQHNSVIRGISMASQLTDRNDKPRPIRLSSSLHNVSPFPYQFNSTRRNSTFSNIFNSFTSTINLRLTDAELPAFQQHESDTDRKIVTYSIL